MKLSVHMTRRTSQQYKYICHCEYHTLKVNHNQLSKYTYFGTSQCTQSRLHTTSWSFKGGPGRDLHWGKNSSADIVIGWRNLFRTAGTRSLTLTYENQHMKINKFNVNHCRMSKIATNIPFNLTYKIHFFQTYNLNLCSSFMICF